MKPVCRIFRAEVMGYCMGVRRAVEATEKALLDSNIRPVYTYGPLIHNPQALERLAESGVVVVGSGYAPLPDNFSGASVVIRAHGIPPEERRELQRRGAKLVDATCPRVLSSQKRAHIWHEKGYTVYLAGDRDHGEITGIEGYAPGCVVLENREDAEHLENYPDRAVLISQTTIKQSEYDEIAAVLAAHIRDLVVLNTICPATLERQKALEVMAAQVDGILVIGGKNSANTQRLAATARQLCTHAWHIETPAEIPQEAFLLERIGITAGASTPDEIIDAVEQAVKKGYS
ncbi:MAG TPA: 4-hydroxy-3-methylbut-2-enyl diphosphate reductase [Treponema sp.]|nr:4-hydroxy-3-methylbut-2-enyl diphosphate reductase [Treponema sp.]